MCCRTTLSPVQRDIAEALLRIGLWEPLPGTDRWARQFGDEGSVIASFEGATVVLSLSVSISNLEHHAMRRNAGAALFEIAARIAERCGSKVTQHSNVGQCVEDGASSRVLAEPGHRMTFDNLCLGFKKTFMAEGLE